MTTLQLEKLIYWNNMTVMDVDFNFTQDYTYITVSGEYNLQDDTNVLEQIITHRKLNKYIPILIDCSKVDFSKITYELIQMATHHDVERNNMQEYRIAIVTPSQMSYDIISQWYGTDSKNKDYAIKIFLDTDEAKNWLNT